MAKKPMSDKMMVAGKDAKNKMPGKGPGKAMGGKAGAKGKMAPPFGKKG